MAPPVTPPPRTASTVASKMFVHTARAASYVRVAGPLRHLLRQPLHDSRQRDSRRDVHHCSRHGDASPKSTVLSGGLSALVVMRVLSAGHGRIVPNLISTKHTNSAATGTGKLEAGQGKSTFRHIFSRFRTPIFLESFLLTFLAEWGDRSQIDSHNCASYPQE
ncbi:GDT1-like protein 4 [Hordeum vulgare subsp. vulgare]|uniref:GDT1-like protein 4 n=1 Tax=Hordeum vulgare subsp. vulgare TaxID=112509 RepID=UPI001D1A4030|nr:GDT1-like protein 4 [Hordeum vulgare subsp. vulgare]